MAPTAHEMDPKAYVFLRTLPCEDQVEILTEIVKLYSDYIKDNQEAREALSDAIDSVISDPSSPYV